MSRYSKLITGEILSMGLAICFAPHFLDVPWLAFPLLFIAMLFACAAWAERVSPRA